MKTFISPKKTGSGISECHISCLSEMPGTGLKGKAPWKELLRLFTKRGPREGKGILLVLALAGHIERLTMPGASALQ
ncbi:hypothetical protein ABG768_005299 [Culter alburnus]|uniref:Uncharacterized protein n=1 Tax=Culter alburnus TaxID=194366 RepID=A0AAW1ZS33_CULAL